ncbi:MAG: hypothetical protein CL916_13185 [Deltaproteobacteria bacterium]|nr:hypothetical protein [Deltaproteobacteria bacterium]
MSKQDPPNGWILCSYYMGVFSVLPVAGIILGPLAVVVGIYGLIQKRKKKQDSGLWMGRTGIVVGMLGSGIQTIVLYINIFRV